MLLGIFGLAFVLEVVFDSIMGLYAAEPLVLVIWAVSGVDSLLCCGPPVESGISFLFPKVLYHC